MNEIKKGDRTTAVWQNGGFSAKFNGSSSIELLCKTEHLCFDFRHFAKLQTVASNMKKIPLILIILTFFGCNQKEKNLNLAKTETKTQLTKKSETIFWIDTISNGKFLKIYSKPENDWQNLTAEYGNENKKHKIDLRTEEYQMLGIPFTNQIEWITEKSFALINGCGTNCRYVLIFNTESEKPIVMPIEYYPEIKYADYKTDNLNLYISVEQNNDNSLNLIIIETDSQKKDKVNLPKDWNRGIGQIYNIIDKIEIKNSKIKIVQYQENGIKKELNRILTLK